MSDDVDQNPDENGKKAKFGEIVSREASSQDLKDVYYYLKS